MVAAYGLTWAIGAPPLDACPTLPEGRPMVVKKGRVELQGADGAAVELSKGERVFVMEEQGGTAQVQLLDGTVISRPIAGTRRRGRTVEEDRRLGAEESHQGDGESESCLSPRHGNHLSSRAPREGL